MDLKIHHDEILIEVRFTDLTEDKLLTKEIRTKLAALLLESLKNYPDHSHLIGDYKVILLQNRRLTIEYPDGLVISDQLEEFLV